LIEIKPDQMTSTLQRRFQTILLLATLFVATVCTATSPDDGVQGVYRLHRIGTGIFVAEPRFGGANSTIVINEDHVVLVDPSSSPANGLALADEIRSLTDKPLRYVVNTHWHGDHHGGNRGLSEEFDDVTFIAHSSTPEDILNEATPELRRFASFYLQQTERAKMWLGAGIDENGDSLSVPQKTQVQTFIDRQTEWVASIPEYEYLLPNLLVEESMTLPSTDRIIEIRYAGRAHTRGDLYLYLPNEKILIVGDLLTAPYVVPRSGFPSEYADALRNLAEINFEQLVIGHGGPVKTDSKLLLLMADFLEAVASHTDRSVAEGLSEEETIVSAVSNETIQSFESRIDWDEPGLTFLDFERLVSMTVARAYLDSKSE
jgi:cyclase